MILNDKYYLDDIESGEWREVSKEEHDSRTAWLKSIGDEAVKNGYKPQIIMWGTPESLNDQRTGIFDILRNPENKSE